ncbi:hypothetical protein ACSMFX_10900 [Pseudomonas mosselii]|uniref:hypothetical protein n=1 Tax=Pseudomonas mosselii TaxID=78327 RepID=UPI003F1D9BF7
MELKIGDWVFHKLIPGAFVIEGWDVTKLEYVLRDSSGKSRIIQASPPELIKSDFNIAERMREGLLGSNENLGITREGNVPVNPYSDEQVAEAKRRFDVMDPYMKGEQTDERRIEAKTLLDVGDTTFNKYKRAYIENPTLEGQIPGLPGRQKGESRIDPRIDQWILDAATQDYRGPGANDEAIIDIVQTKCDGEHLNVPSRATIRRRLKAWGERNRMAASMGKRAANDRLNTFPSEYVVDHPLQLVEPDTTYLDMHVKDSKSGMILGRPKLLMLKDKFSKSILSAIIYFGHPNRSVLAAAIYQAIQPKDELLRNLGLQSLQWIQYGRLEVLMTDKGSDLNAKTVKTGLYIHGIDHINRMRPQSGGGIERGLGILNRYFIQTLEGSVPSARKPVRGEKPEKDAFYTLEQVERLVVTEICRRHGKRGKDGLTPTDRWRNYFGIHDGVIMAPPIVEDPLALMIECLHEHHPTVSKEGIRVMGLTYEPGPYKKAVGVPVRLKIDYMDNRDAWVMYDREWYKVAFKGPDRAPHNMWAWKAILKEQGPIGALSGEGMQAQRVQDDLKKQYRLERDNARLAENQSLKNITSPFAGLANANKASSGDDGRDEIIIQPFKGRELP